MKKYKDIVGGKLLKKSVSTMLVASMMFSFTACQSEEVKKTDATSEKVETSVEAATEAAVESAGMKFPLEEQIEVDIVGKRRSGNTAFEDTVVIKEFEEKTNIKVNWMDWDEAVYEEKQNLAFSTGALPDAFFGMNVLDSNELVKFAEQGYLAPLDEALDSGLMPNYANLISLRPEIREQCTTPDGNLYFIPIVYEPNKVYNGNTTYVINQDWLDAVGKDMPTTTDELYDVLVAFKEAGDLNGNGDDDEIPMSLRYLDGSTGVISGWFGTACGNYNQPIVKDGAITMPYITDDYKDSLVYLNKLYTEGLIDQEMFTMDGAVYNGKRTVEPATVGIISAWNKTSANVGTRTCYEYLPVLSSDNGNEPEWKTQYFTYNGNIEFIINAESEYVNELAAWADLWLDPEMTPFYKWGGEDYIEEVEEGKYRLIPAEDGHLPTLDERSWNSPLDATPSILLVPEYFEFSELSQYDLDLREAQEVYGPYMVEDTYNPSWYLTSDENYTISILKPQWETEMNEQIAQFITKGGIEEGWDEYVALMLKLGMEEAIEIYQGVYDRNQ